MLFLTLTVDNIGVFRGKHTFELTPRLHEKNRHHLTIFHGHNGAGKTTIFQAMILALYGQDYFSNLTNSQGYHNFLRSRMHRSSVETGPSNSETIGTALRLQYVQSGRTTEIQIERRWSKYEHTFKEDLKVLKDDYLLDVDPADYQTWIDDLIPPGIGLLCFFDAEKLDALASEEQQSKVLHETLHRLLGLDRVQRLETDLQLFTNRQGSTRKVEALYAKVVEAQTARETIEYQLKVLQKQLDEVSTDISSGEAALTQQERRLAAEGGAYAARRPVLESRLQIIRKEIEVEAGQIHDLCTELLPFALAPELCLQLSQTLALEIEARQRQIISRLFEDKLSEIEAILAESDVWGDLNISEKTRRYLARQLAENLRMLGQQSSDHTHAIHHFSELEHQQISKWISQSIRDVPKQIQQLGERLRLLKEEKQHVDIDLQRAPDDEVLVPIQQEIQRLRGILTEKQKRQTALNEQIGSLQFQLEEIRKQLRDVVEQYDSLHRHEQQLKHAEQAKNVIRTYKDALMRQKLNTLEANLAECFNKICSKEHLLARVHIDPVDLDIHLVSTGGTIVKLNDFSAGERQLYIMALLWALRSMSGLSLPLAIDTPLARLDEMHRLQFIHDYIPQVSDQVILFTTDAEIDNSLLFEAKDEVARIYQLKYAPQEGETKVTRIEIPISDTLFLSSPL